MWIYNLHTFSIDNGIQKQDQKHFERHFEMTPFFIIVQWNT
jgi:hypothetical protein